MPDCLKRASAAARCTGAARRWSLVLLRCFAMHYCMNCGAQSTATGQQCLGLRPKTGRRGAWLNVGGNFGVPIFVAGAASAPGTALRTSLTRGVCPTVDVRARDQAEQVPPLLACPGRRRPTTATPRTQALRGQGLTRALGTSMSRYARSRREARRLYERFIARYCKLKRSVAV